MKLSFAVCLLLVLLMSIGNAQITIPQSTLETLFTPGNVLYVYVDTSSTRDSVNVGARGGPQTFDFSSLTLALYKADTVRLVSSVPYLASRFPGSALALALNESPNEINYWLLMFENSSLTGPGEYWEDAAADSHSVSHSTPHELFVKFPVTFGDSTRENPTLTDSIFGQGGTFSSQSVIPIDHVVDAYGTLTLPGGESHPCLRFRMEEQSPYNYMGIRYVTNNGILLYVESNNSEPETGDIGIDGIFMFRSSPVTSVPVETVMLPDGFHLYQNFPNPFNPATTISFRLESAGKVSLTVHNILGEIVATLVDGDTGPGLHSVQWNASEYPSGMYFCTLRTHSSTETRRLMLVR